MAVTKITKEDIAKRKEENDKIRRYEAQLVKEAEEEREPQPVQRSGGNDAGKEALRRSFSGIDPWDTGDPGPIGEAVTKVGTRPVGIDPETGEDLERAAGPGPLPRTPEDTPGSSKELGLEGAPYGAAMGTRRADPGEQEFLDASRAKSELERKYLGFNAPEEELSVEGGYEPHSWLNRAADAGMAQHEKNLTPSADFDWGSKQSWQGQGGYNYTYIPDQSGHGNILVEGGPDAVSVVVSPTDARNEGVWAAIMGERLGKPERIKEYEAPAPRAPAPQERRGEAVQREIDPEAEVAGDPVAPAIGSGRPSSARTVEEEARRVAEAEALELSQSAPTPDAAGDWRGKTEEEVDELQRQNIPGMLEKELEVAEARIPDAEYRGPSHPWAIVEARQRLEALQNDGESETPQPRPAAESDEYREVVRRMEAGELSKNQAREELGLRPGENFQDAWVGGEYYDTDGILLVARPGLGATVNRSRAADVGMRVSEGEQ